MVKPRVLILRTAGTNCDVETQFAFTLAGAAADLVHINRLAAEPALFKLYQIFVLPGGFTYGDYVAAGRVMAVEIERLLGEHLLEFVRCGGLVLGICNGFQILLRSGLVPCGKFMRPGERNITLTANVSQKFEARWVRLQAPGHTICAFVEPGECLELPVAHGEGRILARHAQVLAEMAAKGQIAYRYAAPDGGEPVYPQNPNGSAEHIAGMCDATGRIFGLMPHPERHIFPWQHPRWTREKRPAEGDGLRIFRRAVERARAS